MGQEEGAVLCRGEHHDRVAELFILRQRRPGCCHPLAQVALVENDQHLDILALRSNDAARDQLVRKSGFGGDHDNHLRDVGGNQFLLEVVRAIEQGSARFDRADHALVGAALFDDDPVAAGDGALLAAREAEQRRGIGQLDPVLPAVSCDDGAGQLQNPVRASILAAQVKSLRDRPPTSCVL
jgi:hypothetical protein